MMAVVNNRIATGAIMGEYHARCMAQFLGLPVPTLPFPEKYLLARDACLAGNLEILEHSLLEVSVNECQGQLLGIACHAGKEDVIRFLLCHPDLAPSTLNAAIRNVSSSPSRFPSGVLQLLLARQDEMRHVQEPLAKTPKLS